MTITTENVWREFSDRLRGFIARRAPVDAVDDLLSDVFVKVHSRIDSLEDEERLGPWLYQITRNTITDHYRRRRIDSAPLEGVDAAGSGEEPDAAERLAAGLQPMIEQLPDKYRTALVLTEFHGLTQAQMGEELGLSISGAKSRVQRAREMLKSELLACCHFEFDRRGRVIEYEARPRCCDTAAAR